jgi:hypothetical protein
MIRRAKIQFIGPLTMLIAVSSAEGAAYALEKVPTSETLWYLNLKIFAAFQTSSYFVSSSGLPYAQLILIALPLFGIALAGIVFERRFLLAIGSNLSFVYAGFLLYCGTANQPDALAASLTGVAIPMGRNLLLPLILIGTCLVSFVVSQKQYLVECLKTDLRVLSTL